MTLGTHWHGRAIEYEIVPLCQKHGVGVLTYSSLQQGLLTGRYSSPDELRPGLSRTRHFHHSRSPKCRHKEEGCEDALFALIGGMRTIASELGVSMAALALAWVMHQPQVSGTRSLPVEAVAGVPCRTHDAH